MKIRILLLVLLTTILSQSYAQTTALICKQIIDGKNTQPIAANVILVENGRIKALGNKDIIPKGANTIDLSGYTIMPGFIDLHCHPLGNGDDDYQTYHLKQSSASKALQIGRAHV